MKMEFTKMHGTGNDYVYVNCMEQELPNPGAISEYISHRRFGIGSDGLIMICNLTLRILKCVFLTLMLLKPRCAVMGADVSPSMFMIKV